MCFSYVEVGFALIHFSHSDCKVSCKTSKRIYKIIITVVIAVIFATPSGIIGGRAVLIVQVPERSEVGLTSFLGILPTVYSSPLYSTLPQPDSMSTLDPIGRLAPHGRREPCEPVPESENQEISGPGNGADNGPFHIHAYPALPCQTETSSA
jgi:hypothetical protein